jgi:hypothetical protein
VPRDFLAFLTVAQLCDFPSKYRKISDRKRRRAEAEAAHKPRGPIKNLHYVIETRDAAGNALEILGRNALVTPAMAAYQVYVKHY